MAIFKKRAKDFPVEHPNKRRFVGVLTVLDEPSDRSPDGSRGHCLILPSKVAKKALPTLVGMGVNSRYDGEGHNTEAKHGIIETAEIVGKKLIVGGYIFCRDCPSIISRISASASEWGMSFEIANAGIKDMNQKIWTLTEVTFTGAAILRKDKAAYQKTSFTLL